MKAETTFLKTETSRFLDLTYSVKILLKIFYLASSPILTAFLLAYSVFFIFFATLEIPNIGIAAVQAKFFESWCALAFGFIPLIGGKTVGVLAILNILASAQRFTRRNIEGMGFAMTHIALVLLIVSGFLQAAWRKEGAVVLQEGVPQTSILKSSSGQPALLSTLPFSIELKKFAIENYENSDIAKDYSSLVVFRYRDIAIEKLIKMNEPASFGAWTFYQSSYRDGGKTSVLQAVKNPAGLLPTVSVALIMFGMVFTYAVRIFKKSK